MVWAASATISHHTPLAQLLVPEHASTSPSQAAAVVHVRPSTLAQHTCVVESHGDAPHSICIAPPSVPCGGVMTPTPASMAPDAPPDDELPAPDEPDEEDPPSSSPP